MSDVYTEFYGPYYGSSGVFPDVPLGVGIDLDVGGWTGITGYAVQQDAIAASITRGRQNETTSLTPSQCAMRWNNTGAIFDPDNPVGPYYGLLNLNTPVRVSVPYSSTYLRLADDDQSYCSCPDSSALQLTGDFDVRIDMWLDDYQPCTLAGKWGGDTDLQAWCLVLNGDGTVSLYWCSDGTVSFAQSTAPLPYLGRVMVRAFFAGGESDLVTVRFYTAPTMSGSQTQLGDPTWGVAATGFAQAAATQPVQAGYVDGFLGQGLPTGNSGLLGKVYEVQLYNSSGTLVADPVFTSQTAGATSFADGQGNTWTVEGTAELSDRSYRGHFECSSLPEEWAVTGLDAWTPVGASGVARRLQQGNSPIWSAMRRGILGTIAPVWGGITGYWPMEDAQGSTQIASGLPGGTPMSVSGTPAFQGQAGSPSADDVFACSAQLAQPNSASFRWTTPGGNSALWGCLFLLAIPSGGISADVTLQTLFYSGGGWIQLGYSTASGGTLTMLTSTFYSFDGPAGVNGQAYWVAITSDGDGATVFLAVLPVGGEAASYGGGVAWTGQGQLASGVINPAGANLSSTEFGHLWTSGNSPGVSAYPDLLAAYAGETAAARFARLCAENSITSRVCGFPDTSAVMGPQQIDTLMNVLQSCEDADRGQLYEPREVLGLGYRVLSSLQNQAPAASADYALGEVSPPLKPTRDDLLIRNDNIVSRNNGSSYQAQITEGPMSVAAPPNGVGDYTNSLTCYNAYDAQLPGIAGWMSWVGTAPGKRYPVISFDLASSDTNMQALIPYLRDTDIGDHVQITSTPQPLLPPGDIDQLAWGIKEDVGDFTWRMAFNAVPESPFEVAAAGTAYAATAGSQLASGVSSTATSLSVEVTAGELWETGSGLSIPITIAGEDMTVTDISGASSPQTFTVTRSVNGVVKEQAEGAAVALTQQPIAALTGWAA